MSSYAEFMGMFSPKDFPAKGSEEALLSEKGLPPMKIRHAVKQSAVRAVIDGY